MRSSRRFSRIATLMALNFTVLAPSAFAQKDAFTLLPAKDYPVTTEGVPVYTTQIDLGTDYSRPEETLLRVEYPEYEPLTAAEIRNIKKFDTKMLADSIVVHTSAGISRKRSTIDVSFVPIVRKDNRWQRLVSFKLSVTKPERNIPAHLKSLLPYAESAANSTRYAENSVLASGKWVKIRVEEEGIYALTPAKLKSMGFNDMSRVKLYGYGGRLLPEQFEFEGDDALIDDLQEVPLYREADRLLFFAEGTIRYTWDSAKKKWTHKQNTFTKYSYYFVTEGDAPLAFPTLAYENGNGEEISVVPACTIIDNDETNWFNGGRVFYESNDLAYSPRNYKFNLAGKTSGSTAIVDWDISAASVMQTTRATLTMAGETLSSLNIPTYESATEDARGNRSSVKTTKLTAGECTMQVAVSPSNPARLNYIRINYEQQLSATATRGAFSPCKAGEATLKVAEATAQTKLWQIGNGRQTIGEVAASLSGSTLSATIEDAMQRFVLVDLSESYAEPEVVGEVSPQNLHAHSAVDLTIIVPASGKLTEQAERLRTAHGTKQGLTSRIVTPTQIYNEFSSGTPDATAIRRYMKMLYDRAATETDAPRYLLFFGDAIWDNRMITKDLRGLSPDDYLPAYELSDLDNSTSTYSIGTLHSYVTDDYYGFLDDAEGRVITSDKLDLGIGRLPCHDEQTAKIMVDRIIRYLDNEVVGNWKNQVYLLGDNGDNNLHMNDAEAVGKQVAASAGEAFKINRIYQDIYTPTITGTSTSFPEATARLKEAMRRGALIINYNGHGDPVHISKNNLLALKDIKENVSDAMPLWIYASCEITPYDDQMEDLGRAALYNEEGGAIAVMCAARSVYANYNRALNVAFMKQLFKNDDSGQSGMGEALRLAKVDLVTPDASLGGQIKDATMNKLKYALIGDPAVPLKRPTTGIRIDSINGTPLGATPRQLAAGEVVTFSGYIEEADGNVATGFSGTLTGTLYDREQTLTCKGYGNSNASPLQYKDFTKKVFEGGVNVKNGRFNLQLVVPRDISYTTDNGLLTLYAVNDNRTIEVNGSTRAFYLNGSDPNAAVDTLAPKLHVYLNSPDFPNGGTVQPEATFYAAIADSAGISTTGLGIGHNIELVIDGNYADPIVLNDYFSYDFGSYNKGLVTYQLSNLAPGKHTLECRAWDVNENSGTATLSFYVSEGALGAYALRATQNPARSQTDFVAAFPKESEQAQDVKFEVFTPMGQMVWSKTIKAEAGAGYATTQWQLNSFSGTRLPAGLYFFRAVIGEKEVDAERIIVL